MSDYICKIAALTIPISFTVIDSILTCGFHRHCMRTVSIPPENPAKDLALPIADLAVNIIYLVGISFFAINEKIRKKKVSCLSKGYIATYFTSTLVAAYILGAVISNLKQ